MYPMLFGVVIEGDELVLISKHCLGSRPLAFGRELSDIPVMQFFASLLRPGLADLPQTAACLSLVRKELILGRGLHKARSCSLSGFLALILVSA